MTKDDNAFELLKQFSAGIHRVSIVDKNTHEVNFVFSQSTAFNYFCNLHDGVLLNQEWYQTLLSKEINTINLGTRSKNKKIITIQESDRAYDAFTIMRKNSLSAIAIISKNNKIIGNLSASDVRGFLNSSYHILGESVTDFLHNTKESEIPSLVFCKPEHTFREVVRRLSEKRIHRIYIIKGDDVTIEGVITLGDILSYLYAEAQNH